jgi:hypothetical protein
MAANWVNEQEIAGIRFRVSDKAYIGVIADRKSGNMALEVAEALAASGCEPLAKFLASEPVLKVRRDLLLRERAELTNKDAAIGLAMNDYMDRFGSLVASGSMAKSDVEALARKNWKQYVGELI